jgi:methyl-accepting chemotaxis protein
MSENVENLILTQLREMRGEIGAIKTQVSELNDRMAEGFDDVTQRVNGITVILTMLAGHVHDVETRVEKLEKARK